MIAIGSRYLLLLHLPAEKSNWNRLLLISGERCSSFQASAMSLKYDVPDCYGGDHGGWKQVLTGQNVYGKDILQKKWLEMLLSGRNGGSKILPRLYGVATACCVSWQISNLQIWKNTAGKSASRRPLSSHPSLLFQASSSPPCSMSQLPSPLELYHWDNRRRWTRKG